MPQQAATQDKQPTPEQSKESSPKAGLPLLEGVALQRMLAQLKLDDKGKGIETLRSRIVSVPAAEGYSPDARLPAVANEIRARLPKEKQLEGLYATYPTTYHEETHGLNSVLSQQEFSRLSPEHKKISDAVFQAALERTLKENPPKPGATVTVELTDEEKARLPSDPATVYLAGQKVAVTVLQPKQTPKAMGMPHISGDLKTSLIELYLVKMAKTNPFALHLFDEGSAYLVDGISAIQLVDRTSQPKGSDRDSRLEAVRPLFAKEADWVKMRALQNPDNIVVSDVSQCAEIAAAILAHAKAVQEREPAYFMDSGYREVSAFLVKRLLSTFRDGMQYPVFRYHANELLDPTNPDAKTVERSSEKFYRALVEGKEGETLRAFAEQAYGKQWVRETFIDPDIVFKKN